MTEQTFAIGTPTVIEASAPRGSFAVVFEDDGQTGYVYALDRRRGDQPILDAVAIYTVAAVRDSAKPSTFLVRWSPAADKAGLFINGYAHAVFDFTKRRGYSRTNFPATSKWSVEGHGWEDAALDGLR